jgi:iron complex outermembrane receptor protein
MQYNINGFRNNPDIKMEKTFGFVNPKFGLTYNYKSWQFFGSYAIASKEPNRDDFEAGINNTPSPETLFDWELGLEKKHKKYNIGLNLFYMKYKNQLVLTGKINDVGAYTRSNIPNSYRAGIELQGKYVFNDRLSVSGNFTYSENKVLHFEEFIDDYDNGGQVSKQYQKTDISFSPKVTTNGQINIVPFKDAEISLINKYVSRQFLDNTSQVSRSINDYFIQDIRMSYELKKKFFKSTQFMLQLNNIFNKLYVSNGYTFSYIYGGPVTENYYYPMAPFNFMAGINISL